jgi:hypothetical protein
VITFIDDQNVFYDVEYIAQNGATGGSTTVYFYH